MNGKCQPSRDKAVNPCCENVRATKRESQRNHAAGRLAARDGFYAHLADSILWHLADSLARLRCAPPISSAPRRCAECDTPFQRASPNWTLPRKPTHIKPSPTSEAITGRATRYPLGPTEYASSTIGSAVNRGVPKLPGWSPAHGVYAARVAERRAEIS